MKKQSYIVVDDDTTNNMICEFTIKRFDREAEIKVFAIPENALAAIKEDYGPGSEKVSTILFLDLNMVTMTGWEFLDIFMQFDERVKDQFTIYILSSSIEDFTEESKMYPCVHGFLSKPIKMTNLEMLKERQELEMY